MKLVVSFSPGAVHHMFNRGQRSRTCLTLALPGENFLLEMAGFPMPILGVRGSTVVGGT